jgi:protein phosphatase 1 regulatory subunit 7
MSHNLITDICPLENLKLKTIDLSNNQIENLQGLELLQDLEELWASYNKFSDFENIGKALEDKINLTTVYFEGNPIQEEDKPEYRIKLKTLLPRLIQIDATVVRCLE